jgi:hypothetical protein
VIAIHVLHVSSLVSSEDSIARQEHATSVLHVEVSHGLRYTSGVPHYIHGHNFEYKKKNMEG